MNIFIQLILLFMKIGSFAFGGGYAVMSLLFEENNYNHLVTNAQVSSIVALAQSLPGPFAVNSAIGYGYYAAGVWGAFAALLGFLIPCLLIMFLVIRFVDAYKHNRFVKGVIYGITPAVIGVIGGAALKLINSNQIFQNIWQLLLVVVSLVIFVKTKIHPIFIIIAGGVFGVLSGSLLVGPSF